MDLSREHADGLAGTIAPLALDRQRIVHSAAFRRLQYKTQVFVALEEDHFRTRLTHTLEVANLARLLALRLTDVGVPADADLAEVIALAHDLGHPPFGHAGEVALDECMKDDGGFEHNAHSLRVVEYLEHPYPAFRGLNLTHVARECLAKHSTRYDKPGRHPLQDGRPAPLEGQIADVADRLAYTLHDLQDGVYAGLIDAQALETLELCRDAAGSVMTGDHVAPHSPASSAAPTRNDQWRRGLRPMMDAMQNALVADVVAKTRSRATSAPPASDQSGRNAVAASSAVATGGLVRLTERMEARLGQVEQFLLANVYRHHRVVRMDSKAKRIIRAVFGAYVEEPRLLPGRYAARVSDQGLPRVAADYVAGMTDRFCMREHARLFDPEILAD